MKVRYDQVVIGDKLVVSNDGQKEKRIVAVTEIQTWVCQYGDVIVKLTMEDGASFLGWNFREMDKSDEKI